MYNYSYSADVVAAAVGGILQKESRRPITSCTIHSNNACDGALFVAISGKQTDGHRYLQDAIDNGASCVFYNTTALSPDSLPQGDYSAIAVDHTVNALGAFAAYHRLQCHCYVIGVTGSVGKTTTKQFLDAIFSQVARTVATHENYNNEIGVPLTLLSISPHDAYAIVEMGMSGLGEISYLSRLAQPDIAVITNIGTAHLGKLGSRAKIAQAKTEILDGLRPGGKLILDGDEPLLSHLPHAITVSRENPSCDYTLSDYASVGAVSSFQITHHGKTSLASLFAIGTHCAYDATLAFAVAKEAGICERVILEGLRHYRPCSMRQSLRPFGKWMLYEDCYNASYESMLAALESVCVYAKQENLRPVAILGDMLELGEAAQELHYQIGAFAAKCGICTLFVFGTFSPFTAKGFLQSGNNRSCIPFLQPDYERQGRTIQNQLQNNDLILLKGSRALHLEQLLPYLENKL